jgi:hypothetical protein
VGHYGNLVCCAYTRWTRPSIAETAAALWIASAVLKLKDAGIDADSIKDNAVNIIIATVMGVIAFAE